MLREEPAELGEVREWEKILSGQNRKSRLHGGGGCIEPARMSKVYLGSLPLMMGMEAGHRYHLALFSPKVGTVEPGATTCAHILETDC